MFTQHIYYVYDILWSCYLSQLLCNFCNKRRIKLHAIKTLPYSQEVQFARQQQRNSERIRN